MDTNTRKLIESRNVDENRAFFVRAMAALPSDDQRRELRLDVACAVEDGDGPRDVIGALRTMAALGLLIGEQEALRVLHDYVDDADQDVSGSHFCGRCGGTGQFVTMVVNGKPKGAGGICFRCGGKGHHDQDDRRRNHYRDQHQRVAL